MAFCSYARLCASSTVRCYKGLQNKSFYSSSRSTRCCKSTYLGLFYSLLLVKPLLCQWSRVSRYWCSPCTSLSGQHNLKCCTTTEEECKVQQPCIADKQESSQEWNKRDFEKIRIKTILEQGERIVDQTITVKGWIRSIRDQKNFAFLVVNDGSCLNGLQVLVENTIQSYEKVRSLLTGSSVSVSGKLVHR